jgi:hypothetical protein
MNSMKWSFLGSWVFVKSAQPPVVLSIQRLPTPHRDWFDLFDLLDALWATHSCDRYADCWLHAAESTEAVLGL